VDASLRALNRFGLGAKPGERTSIGNPREWLRAQVADSPPVMPAPAVASPAAVGAALRALRQAGQSDEARRLARQRITAIVAAEQRAALAHRLTSDRPFVERLTAFWSNHLCVSAAAKALVAPLAGSYERDAIRPHVLGRFEDMVLASARHPAMLFYLDNFQSIGPGSAGAGRGRGNAPRGLNENYARELLELHTLGVDGGYTQQDVLELAKVLTGWTVDGLAGRGAGAAMQGRGRRGAPPAPPLPPTDVIRFVFRPALHEPGTQTVLGERYRDGTVRDGERAIQRLCRHPSTATFIATKLVRHFVADDPPPAAVATIADTFRRTGGDLRAVSRALVDLPDAWRAAFHKFRTPQDWLVAALRALNVAEPPDAAAGFLRQLRHPLWAPGSPKGFGDALGDWADPDALLNRAELARTIARRLPRPLPDPRPLADVIDASADDPIRKILADVSIDAGERLALALAGPAFQWR
jgi:uncharacterized protein (DUF1800 family)